MGGSEGGGGDIGVRTPRPGGLGAYRPLDWAPPGGLTAGAPCAHSAQEGGREKGWVGVGPAPLPPPALGPSLLRWLAGGLPPSEWAGETAERGSEGLALAATT